MLTQEEYRDEIQFAVDRFARFADQKHRIERLKDPERLKALSLLTDYENDLYSSLDYIFDNSQYSLPEIYVDIFDEIFECL